LCLVTVYPTTTFYKLLDHWGGNRLIKFIVSKFLEISINTFMSWHTSWLVGWWYPMTSEINFDCLNFFLKICTFSTFFHLLSIWKIKCIDFASFYDFEIWFWNCSNCVVWVVLYFITSQDVCHDMKVLILISRNLLTINLINLLMSNVNWTVFSFYSWHE
jgi:hypothetical protein